MIFKVGNDSRINASNGIRNPRLKLWHWVLVGVFIALSSFFISALLFNNTRPIHISIIPTKSTIPGNSSVTASSITFAYPNHITAEGSYSRIPDNQVIRLYVLATDNKYYIKEVLKLRNGTWHTVADVQIGDDRNIGGRYELGVYVGDPVFCPQLLDYDGFVGELSCAMKVDWLIIQR